MSKITLEITEVVNGVSITETPITLVGDTLSAAASTTATGVTFTPAGGIAATNVQAALTELDSEKMAIAGGSFTGDVAFRSGASSSMAWDTSAKQLKLLDGVKAVFGAGQTGITDADLEIFHVSHQSYIRDTGAGSIFIQTDGPSITLGGTTNNNIVSGKFIPGAEATLYHNSSAKITTTANGIDVTGLVEFDSLSGTGAVAITDILDADDMSGASATTLSTSESIKAYVDAQVQSKDNSDEITEGSTNLYFTDARADARITAADTGDLSEGSNLYFTNARADARIAAADTGDLSEGSNLYFTNARADARITAADTGDLSEGSNLYFTNARADARADARIAANLIDEDGFGTDSATRAPSQQSVKQYVADQTANIQGDITNVITGNGLIGGGTSGAVTVAVDTGIVVTKNGTQTLTNKTLTSPDINTPDIDGGTIDGATVGATTPSTGKFTTLSVESDSPVFLLNDTDGTEQFRLSHQGGNSYVSSFGSGTGAYGAATFYRAKNNGAGANPGTTNTAVLKFNSNGDLIAYAEDGSTSILKIDASHNRVGINTADGTSPQEALDVVGTAKVTQLNVRTGTSLDKNTTIKDDAEITSWTETGQSLFVGLDSGSGMQQAVHGLYVKPDGMRMYLIGSQNGDDVEQFSIASASDAFDISKMVADNVRVGSLQESNAQDIYFADDPADTSTYGKKMYVIGTSNDRIRQYTISTAWDLSSTVSNAGDFVVPGGTQTTGLAFGRKTGGALGTRVYVVDSGQDNIKQFDLGTAWDTDTIDVSTRVDVDISASAIFDSVQACTGIRFNSDGTEMYLTDNAAGDDVTQFGLSTPYDIASTITNEGSLYTGESDNTLGGLHLVGTNIYTVDPSSDTIRQYTSDNTGIVIESSSVFIPGDLRVRDQITALGLIRVDGQLRATGGSQFAGATVSGAFTCSTNTGLMRLGGTSGTAQIDLGRSTKTQTVNVYDSVTASGETATVNIGTSGASGSTTNINIGGGVGTCTTTIDADLVIPGETPASATAAGTAGQIAWDVNYIYICTATNTWKRVAIGTW